jgi:hypothetical protein
MSYIPGWKFDKLEEDAAQLFIILMASVCLQGTDFKALKVKMN